MIVISDKEEMFGSLDKISNGTTNAVVVVE